MISFFNFAGLLFWLSGLGACALSRGAIQESNGNLMILTGTLFVVGAAILDELRKSRRHDASHNKLLGPGDKRRPENKD